MHFIFFDVAQAVEQKKTETEVSTKSLNRD